MVPNQCETLPASTSLKKSHDLTVVVTEGSAPFSSTTSPTTSTPPHFRLTPMGHRWVGLLSSPIVSILQHDGTWKSMINALMYESCIWERRWLPAGGYEISSASDDEHMPKLSFFNEFSSHFLFKEAGFKRITRKRKCENHFPT